MLGDEALLRLILMGPGEFAAQLARSGKRSSVSSNSSGHKLVLFPHLPDEIPFFNAAPRREEIQTLLDQAS